MIVALVIIGLQAPGGQAPKKIFPVMDYEAPPSSVSELYSKSAAVVYGVVKRSVVRPLPSDGPHPTPIVEHTVQLLEILKDDGVVAKQQEIHVAQFGGTILHDGVQISVDSEDDHILQLGERAILFLRSWPSAKAYAVAYGPAGNFVITSAGAEVPRRSRAMTEIRDQRRLDVGDFLAMLRKLRTK